MYPPPSISVCIQYVDEGPKLVVSVTVDVCPSKPLAGEVKEFEGVNVRNPALDSLY